MFLKLLLIWTVVGNEATDSPTVNVPGLGSVKGIFIGVVNASHPRTSISAFLGIPFAKPPIDDFRWRAPEAHGSWKPEGLDGTKYGHCCMQSWPSYFPPNATALSEDCLSLNVFGPTDAWRARQRVPVMFWIHGGGYTTGCSGEYPGQNMVDIAEKKVVMVTTNYRLNIFGFLGSPDLQTPTGDASYGNYGMQDQRLAMQWVAEHIAAFGGDPSDITIFGESAGGSSVINHLTQPASFPFYKKAIIESGTYQGAVLRKDAEATFEKLKDKTRCKDVKCLRRVSATQLESAALELEHAGAARWGPTVDGVSLSDIPWNLIRRHKYNNKVPILIGSNRDEAASWDFLMPSGPAVPDNMTEVELDALLASSVGLRNVENVKKLYDPANYAYPSDLGNYSRYWWTHFRVQTDSVPGLGACAVRNFSQNFHAGGTPALFVYLFAHPTQKKGGTLLPDAGPGNVIVGHADEITYVMGSLDRLAPDEGALSIQMSKYWSNFAISGNPNGNGLPAWAKYGDAGDVVQRCRTAKEGGIVQQHGLRKAACDFWDKNSATTSSVALLDTSEVQVSTSLFV